MYRPTGLIPLRCIAPLPVLRPIFYHVTPEKVQRDAWREMGQMTHISFTQILYTGTNKRDNSLTQKEGFPVRKQQSSIIILILFILLLLALTPLIWQQISAAFIHP
jgi:hypothetical protein